MGLEEAMPREALLLVVKVVQVVFHVSTSNHSIFEKNHSFALAGRLVDCYYTQGDALGYGLLGFQPVSTVQVEIISVLCRRLKYFL